MNIKTDLLSESELNEINEQGCRQNEGCKFGLYIDGALKLAAATASEVVAVQAAILKGQAA